MNEILTAIYERLSDQLTQSVYEHVPQDTDYPYVQMTGFNFNNDDTDSEFAFNGTVDVVAFSDYRGAKVVNEISDSVYSALHRYAMPDTATYGVIGIHREFYNVVTEGEIRQGLSRYRVMYETL